ncbi:hypothetical protein V4C53_46870 [Paraburkholderia azotifigens]|uniref:hypothetical protein n=1 Tax=Paraburkholderia azotifigens TaxID=2057004 RepID=UPI00316CFD9C
MRSTIMRHSRPSDPRSKRNADNGAISSGKTATRSRSVLIALVTTAMFVVFCLTTAWWASGLMHTAPSSMPRVAMPVPRSTQQAGALFGGRLNPQENRTVRVSGVLALSEGAAAILAVGDAPPRAISRGNMIMQGVTLAEVRLHSVVLDRNGNRTEITLPPLSSSRPDGAIVYAR